MAYRIPTEEEVAKAIENCLIRSPHMRSQRELCDAVSAELVFQDPWYRIGPERIRRIGLSRGLFTISISYSASDRDVGTECPVCGKPLRSVRNMTLDGGSVELMRCCDVCGYAAKGSESRPARYTITRRARIGCEERVSLLREAETLLNRAAELMDAALRMSGIEQRSGNDSETIRRIASDPAYGGSLRNLALDLQRLESDPVWTMPLTSPKNLFGGSDGE